MVENHKLDFYFNALYDSLAVFATKKDWSTEINKRQLIEENARFLQQLFVRETEMPKNNLRHQKEEEPPEDDCQRSQYILTFVKSKRNKLNSEKPRKKSAEVQKKRI